MQVILLKFSVFSTLITSVYRIQAKEQNVQRNLRIFKNYILCTKSSDSSSCISSCSSYADTTASFIAVRASAVNANTVSLNFVSPLPFHTVENLLYQQKLFYRREANSNTTLRSVSLIRLRPNLFFSAYRRRL